MKEILINSKKYGIKIIFVDDSDYDFLMQWKWSACKNRKTFYAARKQRIENGKQTTVLMHRLISGVTNSQIQVDHLAAIERDKFVKNINSLYKLNLL